MSLGSRAVVGAALGLTLVSVALFPATVTADVPGGPDCTGPAGDPAPATPAWYQRENDNAWCGEQRFRDTTTNPAFAVAKAQLDARLGTDVPEDPFRDPVLWGGVVMVRGGLLLGLRPVAPDGDRFDEDRVGLDHLSFSVASRDELEKAVRLLDEHGVPHGEITTLGGFGIHILPFRDPDNIQVELTAPAG